MLQKEEFSNQSNIRDDAINKISGFSFFFFLMELCKGFYGYKSFYFSKLKKIHVEVETFYLFFFKAFCSSAYISEVPLSVCLCLSVCLSLSLCSTFLNNAAAAKLQYAITANLYSSIENKIFLLSITGHSCVLCCGISHFSYYLLRVGHAHQTR